MKIRRIVNGQGWIFDTETMEKKFVYPENGVFDITDPPKVKFPQKFSLN